MKKALLTASLITLFTTQGFSEEAKQRIAVVNFDECIISSEYGKKEQEAFDSVKNQLASAIEEREGQLQELAQKFNDSDYMDGLSPEGAAEMQSQYQALSEEYGRFQNQYMQVMNQAQMRLLQKMHDYVNGAAEKVARKESYDLILNSQAAFFSGEKTNITNLVINEMNLDYEKNGAKDSMSSEIASSK